MSNLPNMPAMYSRWLLLKPVPVEDLRSANTQDTCPALAQLINVMTETPSR